MIAAFAFIVLLSASRLFADDLPDSVDWREKGLVTEVWNEGGCNSSWAIATANVIESYYAKNYGKLPRLSIQELIDCVNDTDKIDGCSHGSIEPALSWLTRNNIGLMHSDEYMYTASDVDICRWNETAAQVKIIGWAQVGWYFPFTELKLQDSVANQGPVAAGIHKLPSFESYKSGIYYDAECKSEEADHNHYVTVVGYGSENGEDYWIVKNSAGPGFGEKGYIRMARNKDNHCGIASAAFFPFIYPHF